MTILAKYGGTCRRCNGLFPAGALIEWSPGACATHANPAECERVTAEAAEVPSMYAREFRLDLGALVTLLRSAGERGLKFPKARFVAPGGGELLLYVAGERARVPGAVNVKVRGEWLGRVNPDGAVYGGRLAGDPDVLVALVAIAEDPAKAASAYGALSGACSFCARDLTDAGSVEVGYGPVCAEKYGLPHRPRGSALGAA